MYKNIMHKIMLPLKWQMLILVSFCYLFYCMGRHNFALAIPYLKMSFQLSSTQIGLIAGGLLLFYGIGQGINGYLGDKYGGKRLMFFGALFSFLFNLITSFGHGFWSLFFPWCLNGYSQSLGFAPGSKIITAWWEEKERGRAFGWYLFSSAFSSVITFSLCLLLIKYFSWEWLFRIPPFLLLCVAIFFYLNVKESPLIKVEKLTNQNQDHVQEEQTEKKYSIFSKENTQSKNINFKDSLRDVFTNVQFMYACIAMGLISIARYGLLFWMPSHFINNEVSSNITFLITLSLPIGMAIGTLFAGEISDRFFANQRLLPAVIFMFLAAMLSILLFFISKHSPFISILLLFLVGFFVYGPQSSLFALCPEILGQKRTSFGVGMMNAFGYGFSAIGEPIIGLTIDFFGSTSSVFWVITIVSGLSCFAILSLRDTYKTPILPINTTN